MLAILLNQVYFDPCTCQQNKPIYSLYLSTTHVGLDTPIANIIEVIAVVCIGLIIFLISKNKLKQFAI
jgi:hypothetical protein